MDKFYKYVNGKRVRASHLDFSPWLALSMVDSPAPFSGGCYSFVRQVAKRPLCSLYAPFYLLVVVLILTHTKTLPHTLPTLFVFCVFTFSPFISFHISLWNITKLVLKNRKFHSLVAQSSRFDNMKFVRLHTVNVRRLKFSALHLITVMNLIILYLVGVIIVLKKSFIYFFGRATFFPAPFENAASFWMPHFWALNRNAILAPISAQ